MRIRPTISSSHGYTVAEVQADEPSTVADAAKPKKKTSEKDGE